MIDSHYQHLNLYGNNSMKQSIKLLFIDLTLIMAFTSCNTAPKANSHNNDKGIETIYKIGMYSYETKNYKEAIKWFKIAAERGDIDAQIDLGSMYQKGQGVKQNNSLSKFYYQQAATQGDREAQIIINNWDCFINICSSEKTDKPMTTMNRDFVTHSNGTVTHNKTGMIWMRCSLGQKWNGKTCTGDGKKYTWNKAMEIAKEFNYAGYNDWRLPTKDEMLSIVEEHCIGPAINYIIFPQTKSFLYWTATPNANNTYTQAWNINFYDGYNNNKYYGKHYYNYVRLVRSSKR